MKQTEFIKERQPYELPEEQQKQIDKARKLAWATIFFLTTITILMYLTMGSSQAMRTAWVEDIWSMIPPTMFLIATHVSKRNPSKRFPYGFRRAPAIAFITAATAVFLLGVYMLYDSGMSLYHMEHPTIGMRTVFDVQIWSGWLMIAALIYSAIPPVILGHLKIKMAKKLHSKTLHADAAMNKADWSTAVAAVLGILGVGLGWWWADAVAAGLIALDITHDGYTNVRQAVSDLLNQRPTKVDSAEPDSITQDLQEAMAQQPWAQQVKVRLWDEGMLVSGEIFVQPQPNTANLPQKLADMRQAAIDFHWRVYDVVVTAVPEV